MYAERYPDVPDHRWNVIANGYDEESFQAAEKLAASRTRSSDGFTLVHSGSLSPLERHPGGLLAALARLRGSRADLLGPLRVVLRATGHDRVYEPLVREHGLEDVVTLPIGRYSASTDLPPPGPPMQ